jgi:hypothetical protein
MTKQQWRVGTEPLNKGYPVLSTLCQLVQIIQQEQLDNELWIEQFSAGIVLPSPK